MSAYERVAQTNGSAKDTSAVFALNPITICKTSFFGIVAVAVLLSAGIARGSIITLNAADTVGQHSFDTAGHWSVAAAPSAGNDYVVNVSGRMLRTVSVTGNTTFQGDSLTLSNGAILGIKTVGTTTVTNLIVDNGIVRNPTDGSGNTTTFAGNINVLSGGLTLDSQNGPIICSAAVSGTGNLTMSTAGTTTYTSQLTGVNTYTGNTTISNRCNLTFTSTNQQRFKLQNADVSNFISGIGTAGATFNGTFYLDTSSLTAGTGSWNLVNVGTLNETWGGTFGLTLDGATSFTNAGGGLYTATKGSQDWSFNTGTGSLALIPEPNSGLLLLGALGLGLLRRKLRG